MNNTTQDFDGVFRFTNASTEDFKFLWNNVEYIFPAGKCSPMHIKGATDEEKQEIRKKAAKKYAEREFFKSDSYNNLVEIGNKSAMGMPPTYTDDKLTYWIQQCLEPLPIGRAEVVEKEEVKTKMKAFRPVGEKASLAAEFSDELGK